jgi:gamma-glutamyltranspeptidase / glutathione hydrolase
VAKFKLIAAIDVGVLALIVSTPLQAVDISPGRWPAAERERAEKQEAAGWAPAAARTISSKNGVISAIASPIAVQAGVMALREGGTAADAAATVALTEITTQLGSVVSFAGIMSLVYYDAKTGKVYSLDAGYNSYRNETEPKSIPVADMGPLNTAVQADRGKNGSSPTPAAAKRKGRETLVPGFMAGIEATHTRFGRIPFSDLFEPAIWYCDHGVTVNPPLSAYFQLRREFLARTPEGRQFLRQAGNDLPRMSDRFTQPDLAGTLRDVARHGSRYMYTGPWGQDFVRTIQREGGKVTIEDMARYGIAWSEPLSTNFAGHQVYTAGLPSHSAYNILPALNLAEELKLDKRSPFWQDPKALRDLQRISDVIDSAPQLDSKVASILRGHGIDISPAAQLTKSYAKSVAPLLDQLAATAQNAPRHSNAVVVIDKEGSIAAITHTINSVIWGDTGIVVGGIPIPDSAGFQQARLATITPGDRLPNEMVQTIVFTGEKPILATAAIGSSMILETTKLVLGVAGQGLDLETVQAAPPLLYNYMLARPGQHVMNRGLAIPDGAYSIEFVKNLEAEGVKVTKIPSPTANGLRGTVVAVKIDPTNDVRETVETPGVLIFGGAE